MNQTTTNLAETIQPFVDNMIQIVTEYGLSIVGAVVILIVGFWIAGRLSRLTFGALEKNSRVDATLTHFFASLVRYAIIAITIVAVLGQFGVQTASLITVLGAAGLAIGLALQGTLSDLAAGVMLLLFRPLKVGDYVDAGGIAGTVKELNLFFVVLATPEKSGATKVLTIRPRMRFTSVCLTLLPRLLDVDV